MLWLVYGIRFLVVLALEELEECEDSPRDAGFYEGGLHSMLRKWTRMIP